MSVQSDSEIAAAHDEISLGELWAALKSKAGLICAVTLVFAVGSAVAAIRMPPVYRAEVVLAVVDDGGSKGLGGLASQLGGLAGLAGVSLGSSGSRTEVMGTLNSRQLVESYILTRNLMPVLYEMQWDAATSDWKAEVAKAPTIWQATQMFSGIRKIAEDKKSNLITLSIEWGSPATAAQWANDLAKLANQTLRDRAIKRSQNNLLYLNAQLEKQSVVELRQAIYRLIETEVKNVMIAQGSEEYAFKVIDPAVIPERKSKPNRKLIVVLGTFLGLMLSSFYVLASGSSRRS